MRFNYRQYFLSGAGLPVLAVAMAFVGAGAPASAQDTGGEAPVDVKAGDAVTVQAEAEDELATMQKVVISGSRVISNGYEAPTPVTTMPSEQLKAVSPDVVDALRQLPQLSGTTSSANTNPTQGAGPGNTSAANLRDLGPERTLVLLDGRRSAPSMSTGTSDMVFFPMGLVNKVDIVTGGASAAYGSGAVSGVVNFVLDTDFKGLAGEVRGGLSSHGDGGSYGFELTGGRGFDNDRGHIVFNFAVNGQDALDGSERSWSTKLRNSIPNPAAGQPGEPDFLLGDNVSSTIASFGGLITSQGPLYRTNFDADGNPVAFGLGNIVTSQTQQGGDGAGYPAPIRSGSELVNGFMHAKYQLNDGLEVFAEGSYGESELSYPLLYPYSIGGRAYTIQQDNAFLPESVRDVMTTNGISSFQLGKIDKDFGRPEAFTKSNTLNAAFGFDAKLPYDFDLEAYYSHGETLLRWGSYPGIKLAELKLSADAVIDPSTGQIVCRSTLTDPTNGCVPRDVFGVNAPTPDQADYLLGQIVARSKSKQDVVAATVSGEPFSTWAGSVPVAFGLEYRKNSTTVEGDPVSQNLNWAVSNVTGGSDGSYDLIEGFAEALIPLARDLPLAQEVNLNAAIRHTDYSTSGGVTSWKVGLTDQVFEDLRLRGTLSRDIRAPHIGELFGGQTLVSLSFFDPALDNQFFQGVISPSGSNPDLTPELSDTLTLGFVYRPSYLEGFGLSVDYYKLEIKDAIAQLSAQTIVNQCVAGDQSLCSLITRDSGTNQITQIRNNLINVQTAKVAGVDFEASYQTELFGGDLSLRGVATYLDSYVFESPGTTDLEQAGFTLRPHWRGNLLVNWAKGPLSITVSERILGKSYRLDPPDRSYTVPTTAYTNVDLRYELGGERLEKELFLNVSNLFDRDPRNLSPNGQAISYNTFTEPSYYDMVGRYITVGARFRY